MKSRLFIFLSLVFLLAGCSPHQLKARWYLYRAEQVFWKAQYTLRAQRVSFEKRKPHYRLACNYFIEALQRDASIFDAAKLEEASQSCHSSEDRAALEQFESIYQVYCSDHPKECEYGTMPTPDWAEF